MREIFMLTKLVCSVLLSLPWWLCLLWTLVLAACVKQPSWQERAALNPYLQQVRQAILQQQWQLAQQPLVQAAQMKLAVNHNPLYWTYRAQVAAGLHDYVAALSAARRAWQLEPRAFTAANNYAVALCQRAASICAGTSEQSAMRVLRNHKHRMTSLRANGVQPICADAPSLKQQAELMRQHAGLLWRKLLTSAAIASTQRRTANNNWQRCQRLR